MTSIRWERIKELFEAAAELSSTERSSSLIRLCRGDAALLAEVQRLLQEHDQVGDFLEGRTRGGALAQLFDLHTFAAGDLISGRFRIVRFIGQGGMGEVYEAEDLELGEKVALKTIRPEIAADDHVIARFKQEIQLSRKVTHPNVCRIFDIERHEAPSSSQEPGKEVTYLTMELLPGETLAERLRRAGRMTTGEALPLVVQITDGLQAAHRQDIVHGDLKSSNVILVPSQTGAVRAVVTDFGLARLSSEAGDTSGPAGGTGTPAYMAPEQVERGSITTAADIYSLGVVLFEMVTGTLPFLADTPTLLVNKRLEQDAPSPRSIVSDLDRRWERAILRCLRRNIQDRFVTAAEVAKALHRWPWPRVAKQRWRFILLGAAALVLLTLSAAGYRAYRASRPKAKSELAQTRIREGLAHQKNGEGKQAELAFEEARRLYDAAGQRAGVAEALTDLGDLVRGQGDLVHAKSVYESALAISREIGAQQRVGVLLKDIGNVLHTQGDSAGARKSYESALAIFRKVDDKGGVAVIFKDLGNVADNQVEAQKKYEQALAIFKEIGDKRGAASTLDDIGGLLDVRGYLAGARKAFEEEVSTWREMGEENSGRAMIAIVNLGYVLCEQGNLPEAGRQLEGSLRIAQESYRARLAAPLGFVGELLIQEGQLGEARKDLEEALALAYEFGNKEDLGYARGLLAELSLEENRPVEAEAGARQDEGLRGLAVLAESLVALRKFHDAQNIVKGRLLPAVNDDHAYHERLYARISAGRVLAATGTRAVGVKLLESAFADATRLGFLGYQLEARLALGEIEANNGDRAGARARLVSLARDAQAKGFGLIARKAERAAATAQ